MKLFLYPFYQLLNICLFFFLRGRGALAHLKRYFFNMKPCRQKPSMMLLHKKSLHWTWTNVKVVFATNLCLLTFSITTTKAQFASQFSPICSEKTPSQGQATKSFPSLPNAYSTSVNARVREYKCVYNCEAWSMYRIRIY